MENFIIKNIKVLNSRKETGDNSAVFMCDIDKITTSVILTMGSNGELLLHFASTNIQNAYEELVKYGKDRYFANKFAIYEEEKENIKKAEASKSIDELLSITCMMRQRAETYREDVVYYNAIYDICEEIEKRKTDKLLASSLSVFEKTIISSLPKLNETVDEKAANNVFSCAIRNALTTLQNSKEKELSNLSITFLRQAQKKIDDGTFAFVNIPYASFEQGKILALM